MIEPSSVPDAPIPLIGPDGTKYVAVPTERTESWYRMLCQQAADRVEQPVAHWVDLAQHLSFSNTVRKMRGEENADGGGFPTSAGRPPR